MPVSGVEKGCVTTSRRTLRNKERAVRISRVMANAVNGRIRLTANYGAAQFFCNLYDRVLIPRGELR
jgi:hypothetical protein